MTPTRTINLFRVLFICFAFFMGMRVGEVVFGAASVGAISGLIFGLGVVLIDRLMKGFSLRIFSVATFGLVLGLVASQLMLASDVLRFTTEQTRWVVGLSVYTMFGYLGMMLAVRSHRDEFALIIPYVRFRRTALQDVPVVIDTSIVIDGHLVEVCETGFLGTSLVLPRFVLEELQILADSADPLKREKGRRGLDLLNDARKRNDFSLTIHELVSEKGESVDSRLIRVAQVLQARLLTNDVALSRLARLEGVQVLSFRELSHALKPIFQAGDEVELALVKPGREAHQAVGYLPDGGMVVVNHARALVGTSVRVTIGATLQTSSGRMIFADLIPGGEVVARY